MFEQQYYFLSMLHNSMFISVRKHNNGVYTMLYYILCNLLYYTKHTIFIIYQGSPKYFIQGSHKVFKFLSGPKVNKHISFLI